MSQVELALLGRFQARCGGKEISLPTRKTRLLLAYLALPPGEPRARETLIGLLWSDRDEEQARGSLRNALSALRKTIGSDALKVEEDTVALIPGAVETDVSRFESLAQEGTAEALETAGAIYRDDLLKGASLPGSIFQDWLSFEQTRLRELACRVLFDLIAHRIAAGDSRETLDTARRLLAIDPLDEEVHRILMRLYSETNQRAQALRQYEVCARMLEQELGIEPEEETTALRNSIRACAPKRAPARRDNVEPQQASTVPARAAPEPKPPSPAVNATPQPAPSAAPADPKSVVTKTAPVRSAATAKPSTSGTVKLSQPTQKIRYCNSADGAQIAYATVGQGPPLVKTANWLNHLEYDWQGPVWRHLFAELTRDHTLVRYDERGTGLSDWDVDDISFEGFVADLEAVVDAVGLDRFPLFAVSQGCPVAIAYAVRHPERVSHLILHGGYCRGWRLRGSEEEIRRRETLMASIKQGWEQGTLDFQQYFSSKYLPDSSPEQSLWWSQLVRITTSLENMLMLEDVFGEIDVTPLLARVTTPTLVLHSIRDSGVPFEEGRRLANGIPGARFVPLESRNHLIMEHESAWPRFISEIRGFLNTG